MNLPSIEDMPFEHFHWCSAEEIPAILSYNKNDVFATNEFLNVTLGETENSLYKGKNKIQLRMDIKKKYGLHVLNHNDIKLGTELILYLYCKKFGLKISEIRKLRTERPLIKLKDCIPNWCQFDDLKFKKLVDFFSDSNIYDGITKEKLKFSVIYHNFKFDYGTGGCHGCIKPGVYSNDDNYLILDLDIDGMYPSLAITQNLYPQHLGKQFLDIYDGEIVSVRLKEKKKPKKERDFVIVEGFKLAANGTYGKSNSNDSFLYDPLYTMKTTISGQLLISMWTERLVKASPSLQILQVNTDGISIKLLRSDYDKVIEATEQLMIETKLSYEANLYKKMVIVDVNNYIAEYESGDCKFKGLFEIDKEFHKDPSMKIVSIALANYFIKGIKVEQTIKNHSNIYDFCLRQKLDSRFTGEFRFIKNVNDCPEKSTLKLSKNTRYFISNSGGSIVKITNESKQEIGLNVGFVTTLFNQYEEKPMEEYGINYKFYIKECNKIINQIEDKQLNLNFSEILK